MQPAQQEDSKKRLKGHRRRRLFLNQLQWVLLLEQPQKMIALHWFQ
jgi:hypothetical protein